VKRKWWKQDWYWLWAELLVLRGGGWSCGEGRGQPATAPATRGLGTSTAWAVDPEAGHEGHGRHHLR